MSGDISHYSLDADIEGLIPLVAGHLYHSHDAFVRELIQNAADAISRRRDGSPKHKGRIDIEVHREERRITFADDGVGMHEHDVRRLLSVIGASGTREAAAAAASTGDADAAEALIGRLGMGVLSTFLVARRVEVRTRRLGVSQAWRWENDGTLRCGLQPTTMERPGTHATLWIADEYERFLDEDTLRESIVRYAEFIPVPIYLNGVGPQNAVTAPWDRPGWSEPGRRRGALRRFVKERTGSQPLEVIPVDFDVPVRARGVLFMGSSNGLRLYVRRMLVNERDTDLLPPWAHFIGGILECPEIEPVAGRNRVQEHGTAYGALRDRLSGLLLDHLGALAERDPRGFSRLAKSHSPAFKSIAMLDDAFCDRAGELLPIPTTTGVVCLRDLLQGEEKRPVRVYSIAAGDVDAVAPPGCENALNLRDAMDEAVVQRFAERNPRRIKLVPVEASTPECSPRAELSDDEAEPWRALAAGVGDALAAAGLAEIAVCLQYGGADAPPASLEANGSAVRERRLESVSHAHWMVPSLACATRELLEAGRGRIDLWLNVDHSVIRELREPPAPSPSLDATYVGLALCGFLAHRSLLTEACAPTLRSALSRLLSDSARDLARMRPLPLSGGC